MTPASSPIVTVDWLRDQAGEADLVIADVRPLEAYRAGHIAGAIHADLSMLRLSSSTPEVVAAWTDRLGATVDALGMGAGRRVVFYEDISGTMAAYGVWVLDAAGLRNGAILDGGMRAWLGAGGDLERDDVKPQPTSTPITPDGSVLATAGQILDSLRRTGTEAGTMLVDTRGAGEYGTGSIPGAINVEWARNLDAEGRFRPMGELAAMYEDAGLDASGPVATYCAGGFRAANTYVALKALGYSGVRDYAPSWGEWGMRPDTPVERHERARNNAG